MYRDLVFFIILQLIATILFAFITIGPTNLKYDYIWVIAMVFMWTIIDILILIKDFK